MPSMDTVDKTVLSQYEGEAPVAKPCLYMPIRIESMKQKKTADD